MFEPNKQFKKTYDRLFNEDPIQANLFLLLNEIADENGIIKLGRNEAEELAKLFDIRFENPMEYQL